LRVRKGPARRRHRGRVRRVHFAELSTKALAECLHFSNHATDIAEDIDEPAQKRHALCTDAHGEAS